MELIAETITNKQWFLRTIFLK